MGNETTKKLVTEAEAARLIGYSRAFLRDSRCNGTRGNRTPGPPFYKLGRAVRYAVDELEEWARQYRREG